MKIKFCPSNCGYVDMIIIHALGFKIDIHFYPPKCWHWEWDVMRLRLLNGFHIETPTMCIQIIKPKPSTHA